MENENYLTDSLKSYYMFDLKKLFSMKDSNLQSIDDGLEYILNEINMHHNFQTLYSKKFKTNPELFIIEGKSYLELAFTKNSENLLLGLLNQIKEANKCNESQINIIQYEPSGNPNYQVNPLIEIGCINNPDYFRIKRIKIEIESLKMNCHDLFWENIQAVFKFNIN